MAADLLAFPDRAGGIAPERLAEARLALQMSRTDVARELGVTSTTVGHYETGSRRPDMATLLLLSRILKQPVSYFMRRMRTPTKGVRFFRSVGPKSNRLNMALDARSTWLVDLVALIEERGIRFPKVDIPLFDVDPAENGYSDLQIEYIASATRRHWRMGDGPINNMVALLEAAGVIVARFSVPSAKIDAFSAWIDERPYVVLGSDKASAVRSRFDAAHELGHLVMHRYVTADELEVPATRRRVEDEANRFAGAFLVPEASMAREFYSTRVSHMRGLKQRWLVSMQALAHRARDLGILDEGQYTSFRIQLTKRKELSREPLDDQIPFEQPGLLFNAWQRLTAAGRLPAVDAGEALGYSLDVLSDYLGRPITPSPTLPGPTLWPQ